MISRVHHPQVSTVIQGNALRAVESRSIGNTILRSGFTSSRQRFHPSGREFDEPNDMIGPVADVEDSLGLVGQGQTARAVEERSQTLVILQARPLGRSREQLRRGLKIFDLGDGVIFGIREIEPSGQILGDPRGEALFSGGHLCNGDGRRSHHSTC